MKAIFRVNLNSPVTGAQIMTAVENLVESSRSVRFVKKLEFADDEGQKYIVGQSSLNPADDLIILVDDHKSELIAEKGIYSKVFVSYYEFPGEKYAVRIDSEMILENVKDFRSKLEESLNSL